MPPPPPQHPTLLTRDQFRDATFARDGHRCVMPGCGAKADDAHHIIERRLWQAPHEKGGYFLENGASLCEPHHQYAAETCVVQPHVYRRWLGVRQTVLPAALDPACSYDKWGVKLKTPTRRQIKYPSTPYFHCSPGSDSCDKTLENVRPFLAQPIVVTTKMDGSNVCVTRDGVAARNGDSAKHPSFSLLKAQHVTLREKIPEGVQIFGEWLFAKHSIHYSGENALEGGYLQIFAVYDQDTQLFLGWDEVRGWAERLGVPTVPVVAEGVTFTEEWKLEAQIQEWADEVISRGHEGIVVRTVYPFPYGAFESYETTNGKTSWRVAPIAKYVREGHIQTGQDWSRAAIIKNEVSAADATDAADAAATL